MNTVFRRRHSTHSAGVGLPLPRRVGLAQRVPNHDETVRIGVRQGAYQHRVDGAEHRCKAADAERERRDRDSRERRIAPDLPQSIAEVSPGHIEPRAMTTTSNAFLGLFQASQVERGSTAGFRRVAPSRTSSSAAMSMKACSSSCKSCSALSRLRDPAHDGRQAMPQGHAPSSTLVTANDTRSQRSRCSSSWRRPEAVRR